MYWKQESMENEVASIRAASKGQGFIYRTGATPLEEDGPLAPAISVKGAGAWAGWLHACCNGEESTWSSYKDRSLLGG